MSPKPVAIGNNPGRSRSHNRRVVLEAIRQHGPLGRTDIARRAHLTAQAVSNIVSELVAEGLVVEHGRRRIGRGQPPIQFSVNPEGGVTGGIEISAQQITTLLVDLGGRQRVRRTMPLPSNAPDHVVPLIASEVQAAHAALGRTPPPLLGLGVVMPGPFGIDDLSSAGPTTLKGWTHLDAGALIEAAVGQPVFVENDATAAAVGERLHGVGQSLRSFCLVYFGQGLGLGIIADGQPFRGAFGNAGEIGHVTAVPRGRICSCGNHGCLERYASLQALQDRLAEAGIPARDLADIERLHRDRHPVLVDWIQEAAAYLRPQIATIENLFDPETIIFGGLMPEALIADLVAALAPLPVTIASRRHRDVARVIAGTTGSMTAALGAAALPLLDTMTPKLDMARALDAEPIDDPI